MDSKKIIVTLVGGVLVAHQAHEVHLVDFTQLLAPVVQAPRVYNLPHGNDP